MAKSKETSTQRRKRLEAGRALLRQKEKVYKQKEKTYNAKIKLRKAKQKSSGLSLGKKIGGAPKAKLQKRDILKELKKSQGYRMLKDEEEEVINYNRSPFFNEEFRKETKEGVKWLS